MSQVFTLGDAAKDDLREVFAWTLEHFGEIGLHRYRLLIGQAFSDIAEEPDRFGVKLRPELFPSTLGHVSSGVVLLRDARETELACVNTPIRPIRTAPLIINLDAVRDEWRTFAGTAPRAAIAYRRVAQILDTDVAGRMRNCITPLSGTQTAGPAPNQSLSMPDERKQSSSLLRTRPSSPLHEGRRCGAGTYGLRRERPGRSSPMG